MENIFENSDFVYMLNQAAGDRQILAQQLNISPHQLSYVTHSGEGEGLLFYGNVILPFVDHFPTDLELYRMNTYDVKCPVCGVVNHSLFLEETDGWMECEHCGHTAKYCWEPQTKKQIPVFVIRNLQAQVVPADCVHTCR